MAATPTSFIVGWEEWVALPELGLPAIKAKVDTGARTSSLHAFLIEPFGPADQPKVRFGIHPVPGRFDIEIYCDGGVRRGSDVLNGERDTRYFIVTDVTIGDRTWPIEISLTNRETMAYRMLLGRQAIRDDMMVDPTSSFLQPKLGYRLYRQLPRRKPVRRPLRIAVLTRAPASPTNRDLRVAAEAHGHVLEFYHPAQLDITFDELTPGLVSNGQAIPHYDAVIPRIGIDDGLRGAAVVRQFEMMGSYAVNTGDALDRRANRLAIVQTLVRGGLPNRLPADVVVSPAARLEPPKEELGLRYLVIGGRAIAVVPNRRATPSEAGAKRMRVARRTAERAAGALGLGLCSIDLEGSSSDLTITGLSVRPALSRYQRGGGPDVMDEVIGLVESRCRFRVRRDEPGLAKTFGASDHATDLPDDD